MFFKKISQSQELKLGDVAKKVFRSALIFDAINGDLGTASDEIGKNSKKIIMAYGYARRVAVAALYLQGHFKKEDYDHVHAIFKSLQFNTDPSVGFQEQAFSDAIAFMQTYHHIITSVFAKALILIAQEYEVNPNKLNDEELIKAVLDFAYEKQTNQDVFNKIYIDPMPKARIDDIVENITQGVNSRISSKEVALQFVLEELDAARQGNKEATQFVKNSGFTPSEYEGALQNSFEEVDGPGGPQQFLMSSIMQCSSDINFIVNLRLQVLENIINYWKLKTQSDEGDSSSNAGDKFWEWVQNNCSSIEFTPQEIETWGDLKKLELRSNDLSELSYDISILTGLVDLSLFNNNYSTVPEVVFNLTELTWLNLGANQITELPQEVGCLKKLKILDLGQNQLISLPRELGDLKKLEQLIVHNNNLTSLPKEIGKMTALKHISLWDNNLSSLPDEFLNLNNLETINLQNNNFTDEDVKKWIDRYSNSKCKISFGHQKGNISDPIYVEKKINGGGQKSPFDEKYLNSKDGDMASNIFYWPSFDANEDDIFSVRVANKKYTQISIRAGLNAINTENKIVPIYIELKTESPSTEDELIAWAKFVYIDTCNEKKLKPNTKLRIVSVGSSGSKKTLNMMEC